MRPKKINNTVLYQARGVSYPVFSMMDNIVWDRFLETVTKNSSAGLRAIPPSVQKSMFQRTLQSPLKKPYLYLIAGKHDDRLAKYLAFKLFKAAYQQAGYNSNSPYWHTVIGGYHDKIRDDLNFRENEFGFPCLLVISNITTNSTNVKLEKVRDICEIYSSIPRILVLAGDDPVAFNSKHLHLPINKLLYLE